MFAAAALVLSVYEVRSDADVESHDVIDTEDVESELQVSAKFSPVATPKSLQDYIKELPFC